MIYNMKNFLFGASTSAFQIEGDDGNQGRGASVWDEFCKRKGTIYNNQDAKVAAGHYNLYKDDVKLLKDLGVNSYRFSISWSRLLPEGIGQKNEKGIDFYNKEIDELLNSGITPFVTLYHWDLPEKLSEKGGFQNREIVNWFSEYAQLIDNEYGDRVNHYITINEPINAIHSSYHTGVFAPGYKLNEVQTLKCVHNMLLCHASAAKVFFSGRKNVLVGLAMSTFEEYPKMETKECVKKAKTIFFEGHNVTESVDTYLDPIYLGEYPKRIEKEYPEFFESINDKEMYFIKDSANIICYNNYSGYPINEKGEYLKRESGYPTTAMGVPVDPLGLYWNSKFLQERYGKPIYITENGAAYDDCVSLDKAVHDSARVDFYERHLKIVEKAIKDKIDIRGYFAWSLLDNFEWCSGYSKRFGLIYVDYKTLERIPKDSFYWYKNYIKNSALNKENLL